MLETFPKEDPLKQQQKTSNQSLEGYFKAKGKVASWRKKGGSSGKSTTASSFFSHSALQLHFPRFHPAVLEPGPPPLALFARWTALSGPCLRRGLSGIERVCLHCVLNLAGAGASHSNSNYHLSKEKSRPRIHGLGWALGTTTNAVLLPRPCQACLG